MNSEEKIGVLIGFVNQIIYIYIKQNSNFFLHTYDHSYKCIFLD